MKFEELQAKRDEIYVIADKYGVENIRVFGSVARGDAGVNSDVDLLVNLKRNSLFALGGFLADMEDYLAIHVDVVEEEALHPFLQPYVMQEVRPI